VAKPSNWTFVQLLPTNSGNCFPQGASCVTKAVLPTDLVLVRIFNAQMARMPTSTVLACVLHAQRGLIPMKREPALASVARRDRLPTSRVLACARCVTRVHMPTSKVLACVLHARRGLMLMQREPALARIATRDRLPTSRALKCVLHAVKASMLSKEELAVAQGAMRVSIRIRRRQHAQVAIFFITFCMKRSGPMMMTFQHCRATARSLHSWNWPKKKKFKNRRGFAHKLLAALAKNVSLKKAALTYPRSATGSPGTTLLVTLVKECQSGNDGEQNDRDEFMRWLLAQPETDKVSGAPADRARDRNCGIHWTAPLQHFQVPKPYMQQLQDAWREASIIKVFDYPMKFRFWASLLIGSISGIAFGFVLRQCFHSQERMQHVSRETTGAFMSLGQSEEALMPAVSLGERVLLGQACFTPCEDKLRLLFCFLSVMANIVFPLHVCTAMMNTVTWYMIYLALTFLHAACKVGSFNIILQPALMVLPFCPDDCSWKARCFHIFSLMRAVFFLMVAASNHDAQQHMATASKTLGFDLGWYRYREWGMMHDYRGSLSLVESGQVILSGVVGTHGMALPISFSYP